MISTERLDLIPATPALVHAAMEGASRLGTRLGAVVPPSWPPMYLDTAALEFTLARLEEHPEQTGWWLHFVMLRGGEGATSKRTLIGTAGFVGPPSAEGVVEVGYSIVDEHQRRGYATEAIRGMVSHAFAISGVQRVIAETLPGLDGSIGVLRKCGFRLTGESSAPDIIRFELTRGMFDSGHR